MTEVVADYPGQTIHVVLDNFSPYKPKHDLCLVRHSNVQFRFTPTHASRLNQVECLFQLLSRQALKDSSLRSPRAVCDRIDTFIQNYNREPIPFDGAPQVHPFCPKTIDRKLTQVNTKPTKFGPNPYNNWNSSFCVSMNQATLESSTRQTALPSHVYCPP